MNEYVNRVINYAFREDVAKDNKIAYYVKKNYTDANRSELIRIAEKKKILPVVGKFMMNVGVDSIYWEKYYQFFLKRNISIIKLLEGVFEKFEQKKVNNICVYENFGALLASGTDLALYSSGDVDLYAEYSQKTMITEVLAEFGYVPTKNESDSRKICTEYINPGGIIRINVSWKPIVRYSLPITVDYEKYFQWDEMQHYKNTNIRIPTPETLLYLCFIRIAVHGYSRSPDVRLYIDAYNTVCTHPDWNIVMKWAKKDNVLTKFITVAYIANRLNGVQVPEHVLEETQRDLYAQKILKITFDEEKRTLKYNPSGIKLLKLEAASDRRSLIGEIFVMLFPPKKWIEEFYLNEGESKSQMYKNYYRHLFRTK